jgi:transposase
MARKPRGNDVLEKAKKALAKAQTGDELRELQAVVFPLEMEMSIEQTAVAVGRSVRWVTMARNSYIRAGGSVLQDKPGKGGRRRQNLSPEAEEGFLRPFFEKAKQGGILIVSEIHQALQDKLERKVALASTYNLLHRHGWRKLAPDKRHVEADVDAQEAWKKNSDS